MNATAEKVRETLTPVIEALGYEIVDVEYEKKHGEMNLTVFIAAEHPVTLDDCEKVHLAIDPVLDQLNPTSDAPYVLNVSSPGLDRPLKSPRDFQRNYGKMVEVKLFAPYRGKKIYEGVLVEKKEHVVVIDVNGEPMQFEDSKTVFVRPFVSFT
ncbi:MAG: ribosome maturation factor RimP [Firmicutes bacterium]|nr:ribosome maturation factor RimP [Bacillota bacterium]